MYNMLVPGAFLRAAVLLPIIGINPQAASLFRFRDVWLENHDGQVLFRIYTRMGGGNRGDYAEAIAKLRGNPLFMKDEDCKFDSTYASFWFRLPPNAPDEVIDMLREGVPPPVDTVKMWEAIIARIGK
jgi:hypothetical protein